MQPQIRCGGAFKVLIIKGNLTIPGPRLALSKTAMSLDDPSEASPMSILLEFPTIFGRGITVTYEDKTAVARGAFVEVSKDPLDNVVFIGRMRIYYSLEGKRRDSHKAQPAVDLEAQGRAK